MNPERAKSQLKRAVKSGARIVGKWRPRDEKRTCILTYHSIGRRDHEMNVTPADFKAQLDFLNENATVISLEDALAGAPGVGLTFDDGYLDNLTEAAPALAEFGMTGTVFVVAGRAGGRLEHDAGLDGAELMTWEQIREIESYGLTIGAHSMTHRRLAALSIEEQTFEISESKHFIEERLGHAVDTFAYPFGSKLDFTTDTERIVRESGYDAALSNCYGPVRRNRDRWSVRRIWIDRTDSLASFASKVIGELDMLSIFDQRPGILSRRAANRLISKFSGS